MSGYQCQRCRVYVLLYANACPRCGAVGYLSGSHQFDSVNLAALRRLAANLAIGGALCEAWERGIKWPSYVGPYRNWQPGCGRAA